MKKIIITILFSFFSAYIFAEKPSAETIRSFIYKQDIRPADDIGRYIRDWSIQASMDYINQIIKNDKLNFLCFIKKPFIGVSVLPGGPYNINEDFKLNVKFYPIYNESEVTNILNKLNDNNALVKVWEKIYADLSFWIEVYTLVPIEDNKFKIISIRYVWQTYINEFDKDDENFLVDNILMYEDETEDTGFLTLNVGCDKYDFRTESIEPKVTEEYLDKEQLEDIIKKIILQ